MRRVWQVCVTALGAGLLMGGCGGGSPAEPTAEAPPARAEASSGGEEQGCEAGILEMEGGQQVVAIASDEHRYLLLLPVAEDWQVACTGSKTVMEAGSESLAMHLYLHRVEEKAPFDERAMLAELVDVTKEQASAQQGVRFIKDEVMEVEGHLVHESLVEAEAADGPAQAWSYWTVREGVDGSALLLNYMWTTTRQGGPSDHDVMQMRGLMQAIGGAFDILPAEEPA
jgi:hypothetical protein